MLNDQQAHANLGRAFTHRQCMTAGLQSPRSSASGHTLWVQVRRHHRDGPYVLCGRLVELRVSEGEWFKVDTTDGPVWAEGRNVRMCSGDGRCTCEADHSAEAATEASDSGPTDAAPYVRTAEAPGNRRITASVNRSNR